MRLAAVSGIVLRQAALMRGSPVRIIPLFVWGAIDIVLWGFITRYLNTLDEQGLKFVPSFLGAVLLWDFFSRVMQGVTTAFFEDLWSRNFINLFATPLTIGEYLCGLIVTSTATSLIGLVVMVALAVGVFGLDFFGFGVLLVPFVLVLYLFGIGLGIFASALVLRLGPASEWLVWPIPAVIVPFAGVFYPLAVLPEWMQWIGYLLPPSYVFEGMRNVLAGQGASAALLTASMALVMTEILCAMWFFRRVYRYVVSSGLLTRYTAESVA